MPPKKNTASASKADAASDGDKFTWSGDNEHKLLLFMVGTTSFTKEDTERLAEHAFKGTSASAIKQRANKLRIQHRALYESHGWPAPDGKPAVKPTAASKTNAKKRAATEGTDDDGDAPAAAPAPPAKKGRKGKGKAAAVEEDGDEPSNDMTGGIKAEIEEET